MPSTPNELWRLPAVQVAALVSQRQLSAREAAQAALDRLDAVNPRLNAVVDCRPEAVLARADAIDAQLARGEIAGAAGRRAGDRQGQRRPGRLCHDQRRDAAEGPDRRRQQPGGRQPGARRRGDHRTHQHAGFQLPLVHQQPAARPHAQSAQRRADARRLVGRRGGGGGRRHRPHRARHRHRRLDPLPGLCLRRARPAPHAWDASPPSTRPGRSAPSGRSSPPSRARSRAMSPTCAWRWRRWPRPTRATPGGCRRR